MTALFDSVRREFVYLWYYTEIQLRQLLGYWLLGILLGSCVSVFLKKYVNRASVYFGTRISGAAGLILASALGIASPLCMYGTIPIAAAFSEAGVKDDFLAAFMMSSILLNPQLIIYSAALGPQMLTVRIVSCFLCGLAAGVLVRCFFRNRPYFVFQAFGKPEDHDTDRQIPVKFIKNVGRNLKATGGWFLLGILLSAFFQIHISEETVQMLFGRHNGFGVLMATALGVPLYVCGGGTIPLIREWLLKGMSCGAASAFMLIGPSTAIRNMGALKNALGWMHFLMYLLYAAAFAVMTGIIVDVCI